MQANQERLRGLLDQEAAAGEDLSPAGDPAVRAHLQFLADALAAAAPAHEAMTSFGARWPDLLAERRERLDDERELARAAASIDLEGQFGEGAGDDPSAQAMTDRRVRLAAWTRVFLEALDAVRAPAPPVAPAALEWMSERQTQLANTIFAMDRSAKEGQMERHGPESIEDADVVNRIGQAAMLQAHIRFLVEALSETLSAAPGTAGQGGLGQQLPLGPGV